MKRKNEENEEEEQERKKIKKLTLAIPVHFQVLVLCQGEVPSLFDLQ